MSDRKRSEDRIADGAVGEAAASPEAPDAEEDFIARDYEEFTRRFPGVDPKELEDDGMFLRFCGSRYGREPLAELYSDYLAVASAIWEASRLSADDKRSRSTGTGGSGSGGDRLTPAQERQLEEWNRSNPEMKMSAKEFLSR